MANDGGTHATLVSVMFGVALGFWVADIHMAGSKWTIHMVVTVGLTFLVIGSTWWWYLYLGSYYPSTTLWDYYLDFSIAAGLCYMSATATTSPDAPVNWTVAWSIVALGAALKAWLRTSPLLPELQRLVLCVKITTLVALGIALYASVVAYLAGTNKDLRFWLWAPTWVPVVGGVIVTVVCAQIATKVQLPRMPAAMVLKIEEPETAPQPAAR